MANEGLGQAISEGTHFRPTSTQPFTQGVKRWQDLNIREEARKAKVERDAQKQREMFENSIKLTTPDVGKRFVDVARTTGQNGLLEAFTKTTPYDKQVSLYNTGLKNKETEKMYKDDLKVSEAFRGKTHLVPQAYGNAIEAGDSQALKEYGKNNALDNDIATVYDTKDVNGKDFVHHTFNGIPEVDTGKFVETRFNQMFKGSDKEIEGHIKDRAGFYPYIQKLTDEDVTRAAKTDVTNSPVIKNNVIQHHRDEAYKMYEQMKLENPKIDVEEAKTKIATDLLRKEYVDHYADRTGLLPDVNKSGNGVSGVNNNLFNFDITDLNQAEPAFRKAGIILGNADIQFKEGQGYLPSISPPTVSSGNVLNEKGESVYLDNIKLVFIPGKKSWYALGTDKSGDPEALKVTNTTIGSIASVYKTPANKMEEIMNDRLDKDGIKERFNFGSSAVGYNKKQNTVVGLGGNTQPIKHTTSKITVPRPPKKP